MVSIAMATALRVARTSHIAARLLLLEALGAVALALGRAALAACRQLARRCNAHAQAPRAAHPKKPQPAAQRSG